MSSLLEQVDAAMKLFAGLERRVMEIEEIVGTRAPTVKTTNAVAWHLKLLIQQGRIRKPNRVLFAVRQLPSVMSAA